MRPAFFCVFCALALALCGCRQKDEIQVFVHGLPAEHIRVEQEVLGSLSPQDWQSLQIREDIDGVDTGGVPCAQQGCRGVLLTLFIENPTENPWPPPLARIRREGTASSELPIAFSGYEISPRRRGRLRVLLHHATPNAPLSLHLSHSIPLEIQTSEQAAPLKRK